MDLEIGSPGRRGIGAAVSLAFKERPAGLALSSWSSDNDVTLALNLILLQILFKILDRHSNRWRIS